MEALHATFTQPGVRRFVFDNRIIARELTEEIVAGSAALFAERGFGLWLAHETSAAHRAIVGFGAFWHFRQPPELELLYGVADAAVGRGFGREIAQAVVRYGFEVLQMPIIHASTDAANLASQRVLDHLQFTLERRAIVNGLDTLFYTRVNPGGAVRRTATANPA